MDENRDKKPVRKENPVREWISDNLRYMILIAAIIAIVVAVVFGVKVISSHLGGGDSSASSSVSQEPETSPEPTAEATPDVTDTPVPTDTPAATATPTVTPSPTPSEAPAATPAPTEEPEQLTQANTGVSEVVTGYYNALTAKDADALSAYVDQLSQEDRAVVSGQNLIESYSNIQVLTYPGPEKNSYVAFVSYDYKYSGYGTPLPGLTQLYLYQKDDGRLYIASETTEESVKSYVSQILEKEDVKQLIADTRKEYDAVLNAHGDLKAYVDSLN